VKPEPPVTKLFVAIARSSPRNASVVDNDDFPYQNVNYQSTKRCADATRPIPIAGGDMSTPSSARRFEASPDPDHATDEHARPTTPDVIDCFEPATRARLGQVAVDHEAAVRAAIARARAAQPALRASSFETRRRVLGHVRDYVLDHADELCELIVRDSGKTRENAMTGEVWPVLEKLRWTIARGEEHLRPESVSSGLFLHKKARIEYHPLGVIGAIIPWNYPLQNVMNPIIPALMSGNAIVVKPSEWVAWSSAQLKPIFDRALEAEGLSPDLVQVVQGFGETGRAVVEGGVNGVIFIGSVGNGRRVLASSAKNLIPVVLELGGKDPFIVCDDADLEQAVHAALNGTFINCGQNCVASERILVHDAIYERFEQRVAGLVKAFRQGPPLGGATVDVGAMITPLQLELVERLVKRAIEQGARVVTGGARARSAEGDYFQPTVLADVTPAMEIMHEEAFGPVMLLCRFRSDKEAVEIANGTSFGLSASVFSKSAARARSIASRIESGMTAINDFGGMTYMAPDLPFGGVKHSGFGRLNGREGLRALCNVKAVLDDRLPLHFPSAIYPVAPLDYETFRGAVRLLYGRGLRRKLEAARELARVARDRGKR
jgi:acyl-CoA reductase-like NAD-dependent aldehyde dehydrogenase